MYLTRMLLDMDRPDTVKAVISPNRLHGAVQSAFPGERKRILWRIDKLRGKSYLMLLSGDKPDLSSVCAQFGVKGNSEPEWVTKDYSRLLERIADGGRWHFRLTANPVNHHSSGKGERGKVFAHCTIDQQKEWLCKRAEANGFSLDMGEFTVTDKQWQSFSKHNGESKMRVTILSVTFEGVLTVTNADLFKQALTCGIGRGKAYGLGMLTVVRSEQPA